MALLLIKSASAMPWKALTAMSASTATTEEERNYEHHQENNKQDLGDTRCGACNTTEAQNCSDNSDDQKRDCPTQHGDSPYCF
jgi:hypothetical protein